MTTERLTLTPFTDDDMPTMRAWLRKERVLRWYTEPDEWVRELEERDGEFSFIQHFMARLGGRAVGFGQYYACADSGEADYAAYPSAGSYSIDYMLGEDDCVGRGLGSALVGELVAAVLALPEAALIVVKPDEGNAASRACLTANGFSLDERTGVFCLYR
ncbi:MAG: GNAT family N-acetyltransferase [Spirochaetae bacterium HGW-Spirochaetae-3]|jgi:RimJ/RimL family protein N-acetyltransferase|nr:MAG: GNAT family N-acetyltransferase [Spirochaetae bacterium HGW-Spirochaetae-3]